MKSRRMSNVLLVLLLGSAFSLQTVAQTDEELSQFFLKIVRDNEGRITELHKPNGKITDGDLKLLEPLESWQALNLAFCRQITDGGVAMVTRSRMQQLV